jgi:hypothetical protein
MKIDLVMMLASQYENKFIGHFIDQPVLICDPSGPATFVGMF